MRQPTIRKRKRNGKTVFYCDIGGDQFGLGTDAEQAKAKFAELLAKQTAKQELGGQPAQSKVEAQPALKVRSVLREFLDWCERNRAEATHKFYKQHIDQFDDWLCGQSKSALLVADFGPQLVEKWIDDNYSDLSDTYVHNLIRAIQAPFNWAIKRKEWRRQMGEHPLIGLEKPPQSAREAYVTAEQWTKIEATATGEFLDLLIVLKETGCRPQEAEQVEAKHFNREGRLWFFAEPIKKLRGKPEPRIVHLTDKAFEICRRLALKYPTGPLFRNQDGVAWKKNSINCRCNRMRDKIGFKLCVYSLRHTFCTDRLKANVDPLTVAKLMGHKDATMVMKVYNRLNACQDHLRAALTKQVPAA